MYMYDISLIMKLYYIIAQQRKSISSLKALSSPGRIRGTTTTDRALTHQFVIQYKTYSTKMLKEIRGRKSSVADLINQMARFPMARCIWDAGHSHQCQ